MCNTVSNFETLSLDFMLGHELQFCLELSGYAVSRWVLLGILYQIQLD